MKRIFCGTPEFAAEAFRYLIANGCNPIAFLTQPDKPHGRNQTVKASPVKQLAMEASIPVYQPESLMSADFLVQIRELHPDLLVVVAFRLIPPALLHIFRRGAINLHASLLPEYRGASPIQAVLRNDESFTGVTTFFLNLSIDTGHIIQQEKLAITDEDDAGSLYKKLLNKGQNVLFQSILALEDPAFTGTPQPDGQYYYAPKFSKKDSHINWDQPARQVFNQIRAFSPYPGAYTFYQDQLLKILKTEVKETVSAGEPGEILQASAKDGLIIQTQLGSIKILHLQPSGKKSMATEDYLRGYNLTIGGLWF